MAVVYVGTNVAQAVRLLAAVVPRILFVHPFVDQILAHNIDGGRSFCRFTIDSIPLSKGRRAGEQIYRPENRSGEGPAIWGSWELASMLGRSSTGQPALALLKQAARNIGGPLTVAIVLSQAAFGQPNAFRSKVGVAAPTRLDWTFAVAKRSVVDPPPEWLHHVYDSAEQTYQLYGPRKMPQPSDRAEQRLPLVVFVSPTGRATGWDYWRPICRRHGLLYVGPRGTYKGSRASRRIRVVLDVLDDVRRRYPIDPDRTYLTGFYGGTRIATKLAYLLPEYFGGVIAVADGTSLPAERWLQRQLADRLSVVYLFGTDNSPLRGGQRAGLGKSFQQQLESIGARSCLWIYPGKVNRMPNLSMLESALLWLEADLPRRRQLARDFPSTSLEDAPSRSEHARAMFQDARTRIAKSETTYEGLLTLDGIQQRWPDLPLALEAKQLANEYEQRTGPWTKQRQADDRAIVTAQAAARRPPAEIDPTEGKATFPAKYRYVRNWIASTQSYRDFGNGIYDIGTDQVLKRLGSRVSCGHDGSVNFLDLSHTRVSSAELLHFKKQLLGMPAVRGISFAGTIMKESTLRHIADLTEMQALDLSHTKLTNRGMTHFSRYAHLKYLSLASTKISYRGLESFAVLRELQGLDLGETSVGNDAVGRLTQADKLRVLSLAATRINDNVGSELAALGSLEYLDLSSTTVGDATCSVLGQLNGLTRLSLAYTKTTDHGMGELAKSTALRTLSLLGTSIGDHGLKQLEQMPQLLSLNIRRTQATPAGIAKLTQANPTLHIKWDGSRRRNAAEQKPQPRKAD